MAKIRKQEALDYHSQGKPGKIEVRPTKPYSTQRDLALAYSPGVAEPCKKIEQDKELAYKFEVKDETDWMSKYFFLNHHIENSRLQLLFPHKIHSWRHNNFLKYRWSLIGIYPYVLFSLR